MTPVSFIKSMESYNVSFVSNNLQTWYDSRNPVKTTESCQVCRWIIMRLANSVTIWVEHLLERPEASGPNNYIITTLDQTVQAMH